MRASKTGVGLAAGLLAAAWLGPAHSHDKDELAELLQPGPLVRVELDDKGKFKRAMAVTDVSAPADIVWDVLLDFQSYREFMPRLTKVKVSSPRPGVHLVTFEIDTPIVRTIYTHRYETNPRDRTIDIVYVNGDLPGSSFQWKVEPLNGKTRLFYSGTVSHNSGVIQRFEDDQQTVTIGMNVLSLLQATKSMQQRAERLAAAKSRH